MSVALRVFISYFDKQKCCRRWHCCDMARFLVVKILHILRSLQCYDLELLLLIMVLQLFMQNFGLLNQFLPSSSILDKGLPIWHFQLLYIFSNIILPPYLWSSYWPSWHGFPGVYCLHHSCSLYPFDVTNPSQSLCANKFWFRTTTFINKYVGSEVLKRERTDTLCVMWVVSSKCTEGKHLF